MKVSFVILNYKTPHHLRLCLQNLQKLDLGIDHEFIVVDNASGDESVRQTKALFPSAIVLEQESNVGHPAGNNAGISKARGDYVVIVNPDIIFRSKSDIEQVVAYMDAHPTTAMVGPKLRNPDGTVQNSCLRQYSKWTPVYRRTFLRALPFAKKDIERHLMADFNHDELRDVEWVLGACLFIRKEAIEQFGPMDERFFLYFGDYEWCDRARQHGKNVVYFPWTEEIYHYHKRQSDSGKASLFQAFTYVTRIHLKDWLTYRRITRENAKSA